MTSESRLRTSAVVGVLMLAGCGDCIGPTAAPHSTSPVNLRDVPERLTRSTHGARYGKARRQADTEITAANAEQKLEELRREIDEDDSYEAIE